jgi:glutamate-1-semialdehyde 2,1-aminomutase
MTFHDRACDVLVGGVNSPVRAFKAVGGRPILIERAEGPHIFDVDGNRSIDLVGAWGPAIVGHAHPRVVEAVRAAAGAGLSFGATCPQEIALAAMILRAFPSCELIRFVNTGTEATMSAVRLARAATKRTRLLKFLGCYHGHVDPLLVAAGSGAATHGVPDSAGVPESVVSTTFVVEYNDLEAARAIMNRHGREIAAIIVEPIAGNMGMVMPAPGFLAGLRDLCDASGSLLIFDEVMTGFRVGWGGYQSICGVRPDLTCLGKIIGGGLPAAAYAGPRTLMEMISPMGPVYQAGTYSGNPLAMAAGLATLELCRAAGFYENLGAITARLAGGLRDAAAGAGVPLQVVHQSGMLGLFFSGQPVRRFNGAMACDRGRFARFYHAMLARGVWLPPSPFESMFVSAAHGEREIDAVIAAARESFAESRS